VLRERKRRRKREPVDPFEPDGAVRSCDEPHEDEGSAMALSHRDVRRPVGSLPRRDPVRGDVVVALEHERRIGHGDLGERRRRVRPGRVDREHTQVVEATIGGDREVAGQPAEPDVVEQVTLGAWVSRLTALVAV
jgi:hypothetical protein